MNRFSKVEGGFTLVEALLTLFGLSLMMVIFMSFFSVTLDQSVAVEVDSEVVRSEKRLKAWLMKDVKENYIVDMGVADSSGGIIKGDGEEGSVYKVFKMVVEVEDGDEWVERDISYVNGSIGDEVALFREEEGNRSKVGNTAVEGFRWNAEDGILEIEFDYGFTKIVKVNLKE